MKGVGKGSLRGGRIQLRAVRPDCRTFFKMFPTFMKRQDSRFLRPTELLMT